MQTTYEANQHGGIHRYACTRRHHPYGEPPCQQMAGAFLDRHVVAQALSALAPRCLPRPGARLVRSFCERVVAGWRIFLAWQAGAAFSTGEAAQAAFWPMGPPAPHPAHARAVPARTLLDAFIAETGLALHPNHRDHLDRSSSVAQRVQRLRQVQDGGMLGPKRPPAVLPGVVAQAAGLLQPAQPGQDESQGGR
jgi:hypothetical protein